MKIINKKGAKLICIIVIVFMIRADVFAQLNPLISQYYFNPYSFNPAFAGAGGGIEINGAYSSKFNNFPGSPKIQIFTAEIGTIKKVGLGLKLSNDHAGLLSKTRAVFSYAYRLPVSEKQSFFFGLSMGALYERLSYNDISGNLADPDLMAVRERKTYLDGDFGFAYLNGGFKLEGTLPNLKTLYNKEDINFGTDRDLFYTAIAYRINIEKGSNLEPKLTYRKVRKYRDIMDFSLNYSLFEDQLYFLGLYRTTGSLSFGTGIFFKKSFGAQLSYTTSTTDLEEHNNGDFELGLKYRFGY